MKSKILAIVFLFIGILFPQNSLKVISSDFQSIILEFTPEFSQRTLEINNQEYYRLNFDGGYASDLQWGEPEIPYYNFNIGVPSETGNTIEILNTVYKEIQGKIVPTPKPVIDGELYRFEYEVNENYYSYSPEVDIVTFGEYGIARDLNIQSIKILPVKYNPNSENIRLYSKITFRINFAPSQVNINTEVDDLLTGSVINYNVARYWKQGVKRVSAVSNSVLATGKWFKFEAPEEGFYRITRQMLSSFGIDANTVDPRTIKIYNNGGRMLPEDAGLPRPVDLVENAIWVIGEEDGVFNENDYILFYGRGNTFWDYDTTSKSILRRFHNYSNSNYYWITSGGNTGKRIQNKPGLNTTPEYVQTTTPAFADWEIDRINLAKSGRVFLGDDFSQSVPARTYMNTLNNRVESFPVSYRFRFINASSSSLPVRLYENSNQIYAATIIGYGTYPYSVGTTINPVPTASFSGILPDNRSVLRFEILPSSVTSVGYLDYFEITYQKYLVPTNNFLKFFSKDTTALIEYRLGNFPSTNIKVFDVTDYANVGFITDHVMLSLGECRFQIQENIGRVSAYIAIGNDEFKAPVNPVEVGNSNVRGISDGARFIIITHKNFIEAANRLKTYREGEAKIPISTIVIDVEQIINEFSGGVLDVSAVRDFIKYAYTNWVIEPEYVLFFGSGNYDYKNIEGFNTNYVPTWQSIESLDVLGSYTTDDFFVKIDGGNDTRIDLAPGRITVKTLAEAHSIIDKIIAYENNSEIGLWRNVISLVADDAYTSSGFEGNIHTPQAEDYTTVFPKYIDANKIYLIKYPVVLTGGGKRMPEVNTRIIESINNGNLIMNYVGHGNEAIWAHEVVFDKNTTLTQLNNRNKYFFLIAATCSFGYFDVPNLRSGSEELIFLQNAGAIGALVAGRLVFSNFNYVFNKGFYEILFNTPRDFLGYPISIGKANFETKQIRVDSNSQKYLLFGDPTVRLNLPLHQASIDTINNMATVETDIQIKALGKVTLKGKIVRPDNSFWDNYNGEGILNVYDSERRETVQIRENNNYTFTVPGGVIFRGRISVNNGQFSADFVVPKDISYENNRGKVVLYFYDSNEDGIGFSDKVLIGGTDTSTVNDGKGPEIEIYFDDLSFGGSYLVNPDAKLIVKLYDETGINTTGTGIGHALQGILNNKETDPIDFTNYFTGDLDAGGKSGEINYNFINLETGDYHLRVQAWDVFNNFSAEETYFSVVSGDDLVIRDVFNYPNPFTSFTTFTFQQNLNSLIDVEVKIYTLAGRQVKIINQNSINDKFVRIDWDGRDNDGDLIANGAYLYKLKVSSIDGQFSKSVLGKLAVIR